MRKAFPDGVMPAINVFEVGGAHFVEDGHDRVALAREGESVPVSREMILNAQHSLGLPKSY